MPTAPGFSFGDSVQLPQQAGRPFRNKSVKARFQFMICLRGRNEPLMGDTVKKMPLASVLFLKSASGITRNTYGQNFRFYTNAMDYF
jgi:hypothetical protein